VTRRPRIGFLLPRSHCLRYSTSNMAIVLRELADAGAVVEVIHPTANAIDLSTVRVAHDLYVLRKMSGVAFSLAGALHQQGAAVVNPYPVSAALRDKIVTSCVLQRAGVPTPPTYVTSTRQQLAPLLDEGPLVIKPYQGAGGYGVHIVRSAAELERVELPAREPVFAQRYLSPDGRDRKIYAIGDRLFGVKKVFPRSTEADHQGEPFTVPAALRDIAVRCGRAFDIDLFGVDIIESGGRPYVVDMTSIPGYKGVADAPRLLAQYFYAAAVRSAPGAPALAGAV
jgi:ribosomal protein S6--L-glutamate ligase